MALAVVGRGKAGNSGGGGGGRGGLRSDDGDDDCCSNSLRGARGESLGLTGDGVDEKSDFLAWRRLAAGPVVVAAIGDGDAKSKALRLRAADGVEGVDGSRGSDAAGRRREGMGDADKRPADDSGAIGERGGGEHGDDARCSDGESKANGSKAAAGFVVGALTGVMGEQSVNVGERLEPPLAANRRGSVLVG
jgi:hypothetical protein